MNKMNVENVPAGTRIALMNGVVIFEGFEPAEDGRVNLFVSIGTLRNHKVRDMSAEVHVVRMSDDVAAFFGV